MRDIEADWRSSGLAALTVGSGGVVDLSRAPVLAHASRRLAEFTAATDAVAVLRRPADGLPDAATLMAGRAALLGLHGRGRVSANGTTRLMRSAQGWWGLSLARPDDVDMVGALLETSVPADDVWSAIDTHAQGRSAAQWVSRARLLDLPAALLGETDPDEARSRPRGVSRLHHDPLLVVDLSSLWAGPLCSRLLADAGATVVKVESPDRPDGTRVGNADFFRWMNQGKLSFAVDFRRDRGAIRRLLRAADVVIEGSRPRALRRLGLGPDDVEPSPGQVWIRITGHGTAGDRENWIAFGDDAAIAGGLVGCGGDPTSGCDGPVFCGDAIADPLTGIESARAVARSLRTGGGVLLEISLAATAAYYAQQGISGVTRRSVEAVRAPPARVPTVIGTTADIGADNARVAGIVAERLSRT